MKEIVENYVNFSEEINERLITVRKGLGNCKTTTYGAIISNYESSKKFDRKFIDFDDFELYIKDVNVNDVIELNSTNRISNKYCKQSRFYIYITAITPKELSFEMFETCAGAIKYKNKSK